MKTDHRKQKRSKCSYFIMSISSHVHILFILLILFHLECRENIKNQKIKNTKIQQWYKVWSLVLTPLQQKVKKEQKEKDEEQ